MAMLRHPPPGRPAFMQAAHPSTMPHYYNASSMKAIGIRCWPDSHQALPGCPSEGGGKARYDPTSALSLSAANRQRGAQRTHRAPCPPREHPPAGANGRVSPSSCYAQVLLRPALRPRPAHCTLMSGCTRTHCLPSARDTHIYRPTPAAPRVCERLKRGLRPYPTRYRSSTPRSGPRCAAQVHGAARWSTRRRILR